MIYFVLLACVVAAGIPLCKIKYGKGVYCGLTGTVLFIMSAIRSSVGYDYNLYASWFVDAISSTTDEIMLKKVEKGYLIPIKLISDVTNDYQVLFIITAFIIIAAITLYIYFNSEKPWLSFFCFLTFGLFFNSMDFMRQMIAAVIILLAFRYLKANRFLPYLVLVLFASSFHISSLIMIPFYFILKIKLNRIVLAVYSAAAVLMYIFSWDIVSFVTEYVYKGYGNKAGPEVVVGTDPIYTVYFGIFFVAAFAVRKTLEKTDEFNNVLLNCMFFTVFFEFMGTKHAILSRFVILFFIPAITILIPRVMVIIADKAASRFIQKGKKYTAAKAAVVISTAIICCGMYGYMIHNNYNGVMPYKTIYSEASDAQRQNS